MKEFFHRWQKARERIAKDCIEAEVIAFSMGVPIVYSTHPAYAFDGPMIDQPLFQALLLDTGHVKITQHTIMDAINKTIGGCEHEQRKAIRRIINPFYWLFFFLKITLRLPFILLKSAGFKIETIESHLAVKIAKTVLGLLIILLLIYLGVEAEIITRLFTGLLH